MLQQGVLMSGWLQKEGKISWKKVRALLQDGTLMLYKIKARAVSPREEKPKWVVSLDGATVEMLDGESKSSRFVFAVTVHGKTMKLGADTQADRNAWAAAIKAPRKGSQEPSKVGKEDFTLVKLIGKGNFGRVMLVTYNATGQQFAMKVLSKKQIIQCQEIEHTMGECAILQKLAHPCLVKLHYSFQTDESLFLVLDFVNGGELFFHLQREKQFDEPRVRFYAAQILLGLEYLHDNDVLYRDLKLENVLLTREGFAVLTDFGLSKDGLKGDEALTTTFCGTPEYMAPEVLQGKPYGKKVDWWSFGALIFEMLAGLPPFYSQDVQQMYHSIVNDQLVFPDHLSETARNVISRLMQKDPAKRLTDPSEIKKDPFFQGVDWDALVNRTAVPPFVPQVKDEHDLSMIDQEFTKEVPSYEDPAASAACGSTCVAADKNVFAEFTYPAPTFVKAT
eukprot:m51a1_g10988 putative ph-protein kinase domain containing protein (449) ;mRNA; f:322175-324023